MTNETIILEDLGIGYQHHIVAEDINASLHDGELTCLIGANGVGKSTLLRTLAAFQPPLSGKVSILGKPLQDYSPQQLARLTGVVLATRPDAAHLTVRETVAMGRSPYTGFWGTLSDTDDRIVEEAMRQVGISHLANRMTQTLSDGERQKVMVAKALAQQTPIIFLDEPTAFLDFPSKVETLQMLRRLAHKLHKTVFLSTHDVELAFLLSDSLWVMEAGSRLSVGSPRELADDGTLARFVERGGITFDPATLSIRITAS